MLKAELPSERLARTRLETKRSEEAARRERVFNDTTRTVGVDRKGLDMQVEEKKKQKEAEREEQIVDVAKMLNTSKLACLLQNQQVKERRAMEKAVVSYRQQYQQPQSRREFDLNDPDRLKTQKARDAQMMIPGLVGEDPHHEDRQQRQREQLREWLIQQQREHAAEKQQQELERLHYDRSRVDTDNRALQLQKMEMEKRRAAAVAATKCNRAMAEEKKQMDKEEKPFPSKVGVPGLCHISNRKAPPESLQQVTQFQKHQIEEKKRMELERRKQQEHFHHMTSASARTVLLKERQEERLRKQLRRQLDSANIQLAESRKQRQPDLERGRIDDSFFSKFNTCSR